MADKLTLDKQAMKDAATAHLRIYVGGLTDDTTTEDLYNHFIEYGEIDGIVTNKVFGFVQFKNESSAQEAINKANGSLLKGKKLTVRTAQKNNPKRDMDTSGHMDKSMSVNSHDGPAMNDNDESYDAYGNYVGEQNYRDEEGYEEGYLRGGQRGRGRGRKRGRGAGGFRDRSPQRNDWSDRNYDRFSTEYPRSLPVTERNDCEIIVVSKTLTEYAEYIETRLKRLGIVVDLLFPMEDVPIGKVLGNIASRGCLYAILVMPPNLEHRSLTLTILHGMPQEHRNMALEDALQLLSRNFQEVQRGGATGREAVYALLGQLADGKSLTVAQLDKVIEYLKARREKQAKIEMGDPSTTQPTNKTQEELQQRILNILNEKKAEPAPPPQPPKQDTQNKLLNDPTVRKALDSILQKLV